MPGSFGYERARAGTGNCCLCQSTHCIWLQERKKSETLKTLSIEPSAYQESLAMRKMKWSARALAVSLSTAAVYMQRHASKRDVASPWSSLFFTACSQTALFYRHSQYTFAVTL